jgi:hypothetical protein
MDHPELVTAADRRIMIGVLANLAAAFLGAVDPSRHWLTHAAHDRQVPQRPRT